MTAVALRSSLALKFDLEGVAAVMRTMSVLHFYKSMTSYDDTRQWQDVYHVPFGGRTYYIKFTDDKLTEFRVLSFKERGDA